jgi:exodeoxyribonuclease V alpha subunit
MSLLLQLHRAGCLRTLDHALAESLRRLRPDTPDIVLAAIALGSRAVADGHSALPLARVAQWLPTLAGDAELPPLPELDDWRSELRASPWLREAQVAVLDGDLLYLQRYWRYEQRLLAAIASRLRGAAAGSRLRLLTGGPGTGKTTQAARVLCEEANDRSAPLRIALAAPTGKAASRLGEVVHARLQALQDEGVPGAAAARGASPGSATVHRLLGWSGDGRLKHDAGTPLPFDIVVVDEASMLDLPFMVRLFEAVAPEALLLLIGDPDQLPSVDTGNVLSALCAAGADAGVGTNAFATAIPRTHLTQTHRQSSDNDIAELAALVRDGDADAVIAGLRATRFRGVHWRPGTDRELGDHLLAETLADFRALQVAASAGEALQRAQRLRVLTAVREGPAGQLALNALLGARLDPQQRGLGPWRGQLLLVTRNQLRHGLHNGDVGVFWPDELGQWRVWFEHPGSEEGVRSLLPSALPAHEPAYALTVHKAQGSEFERVLLVLPERGARVLTRELLYTGLTRARRELILWAGENALREAIARPALRWSGLAARLQAACEDGA